MKINSSLFLLLLCMVACSDNKISPEKLYGKWHCKKNISDTDGDTLIQQGDVTYHKDGSFERTSQLSYNKHKNKKKSFKINYTENGNWSLVDKTYTEMRQAVKVTVVSGNFSEKGLKQHTTRKFEIISLTNNELRLHDDEIITCKK